MQGRHDEAEKLCRETLDIRRRVLGAEHPETLQSMNNLAGIEAYLGKYAESERLCRETLENASVRNSHERALPENTF